MLLIYKSNRTKYRFLTRLYLHTYIRIWRPLYEIEKIQTENYYKKDKKTISWIKYYIMVKEKKINKSLCDCFPK